MRDLALAVAKVKRVDSALGKDGRLDFIVPHTFAGRGKITRHVETRSIYRGARTVFGGYDTGPTLFDLAFLHQTVEDRLLAVVVEHVPLELDESVVDLMGRDSGRDLIDVCSGQGAPSSSVNHCVEIQFSEGVIRIPAQL